MGEGLRVIDPSLFPELKGPYYYSERGWFPTWGDLKVRGLSLWLGLLEPRLSTNVATTPMGVLSGNLNGMRWGCWARSFLSPKPWTAALEIRKAFCFIIKQKRSNAMKLPVALDYRRLSLSG